MMLIKTAFFKILIILLAAIFLIKLIQLSLYQSFHLDEAYYLGASVKILAGDLFLTNHIFDKPIFQALWPIPGILMGGQNLLGFRLSAIIASLISFVAMRKLIPASSMLKSLCLLAAILFFFSNPFVLPYLGSSMGEPFLLISFIFFMKNYIQTFFQGFEKNEQRMYIWYAIALCTKQSALMWAPVFLPLFIFKLQQNGFDYRRLIKDIFKNSKWVFIITLAYQLLNERKFAAIRWFHHLREDK